VSVGPSHSTAHGPLAVGAGFDSAAVVPVDSTAPGGLEAVDAEFDAVRSAPDQLLALTFQDLSTGPVTGWLWQFGDGATSSEQSPRHDYQAPGRFDVKLLVNGPAGSDERSMTVELPAQQPGYLLGLYWPPLTWVIGALIALLSGLILLYLAWLSWGAGTHRRENRVIACLLVTEAVGCMTLLLPFGLPASPDMRPVGQLIHNLHLLAYIPACGLYLAIAGLQGNRLSAPFGYRLFQRFILPMCVLAGLLLIWSHWGEAMRVVRFPGRASLRFWQTPTFYWAMGIYMVVIFYVAVTFALCMRSAPAGSKERARLRAYLTGFGLRFGFVLASAGVMVGIFFGIIPASFRTSSGTHFPPGLTGFVLIAYSLGNLLFGLMFACGVLRGQILGIDRLFKVGLNRAVMGFLLIMVFFLAEQAAESLLSDRFGMLGGLTAAGGMLFFQESVMKLINRSTNIVMTVSSPVSGDRLAIYRDHFVAAMSDGNLSAKDRMMLGITATTLGLTNEECAVVEAELAAVPVSADVVAHRG